MHAINMETNTENPVFQLENLTMVCTNILATEIRLKRDGGQFSSDLKIPVMDIIMWCGLGLERDSILYGLTNQIIV